MNHRLLRAVVWALGMVAAPAAGVVGCDHHGEWRGDDHHRDDRDDRDDDGAPPDARSPATPGGACGGPPVQDGDDGAAVVRIVEEVARERDLTSVLYRVTRGDDVVAHGAWGSSMTGVPADTSMHFRNGNVAFAYMATLLLLMAEAGEVDLDDPIATWLPGLDVPDADRVTLEMLALNTTGYPDYVRDPAWQAVFLAQPFAHFEPSQLYAYAFSIPTWYPPGTSWSYSHTNYVILGAALEAAGGRPLGELLVERVLEPMALHDTRPTYSPAVPEPALHSFSAERGFFEDTTFWNPSWQTAPGAVLTTTICDMATSARAVGSGALLSDASYDAMLDPRVLALEPAPGCPPEVCRTWTEDAYYGLGVIVFDDWIVQRPLFGGAGALHAHLPAEDVAVALVAVTGPSSEIGVNHAEPIWKAIAAELTPANAAE